MKKLTVIVKPANREDVDKTAVKNRVNYFFATFQ